MSYIMKVFLSQRPYIKPITSLFSNKIYTTYILPKQAWINILIRALIDILQSVK